MGAREQHNTEAYINYVSYMTGINRDIVLCE